MLEILKAIHGAAIVGFVASMPISIASCQILLGVAWISWLLICILERQWLGFGTSVDISFLIFLFLLAISSILSPKPIESFISFKKIYLLSAVYLVAFSVKDKKRYLELLFIYIFMCSLAGLYGIIIYVIQGGGKLVATQSMAMTSGGIFMLAALLAVPFIDKRMTKGLVQSKWIMSLIIGLLLLALMLTKTVSSWLGYIAGIVFIGLGKSKYIIILGLLIIIIISVFVLSGPNIDLLSYDKGESMRVRIIMWETAWKMFQKRPFWGWGMIDLAAEAKKYRTREDLMTRGYIDFGHMHNNFVHIAVTMGVFGLVAFGAMWGVILYQVFKEEKRAVIQNKMLIRALGAAIIAFLVNGLAEWNFGDSEVITIVWFLVGMVLSAQHYGYLTFDPKET